MVCCNTQALLLVSLVFKMETRSITVNYIQSLLLYVWFPVGVSFFVGLWSFSICVLMCPSA